MKTVQIKAKNREKREKAKAPTVVNSHIHAHFIKCFFFFLSLSKVAPGSSFKFITLKQCWRPGSVSWWRRVGNTAAALFHHHRAEVTHTANVKERLSLLEESVTGLRHISVNNVSLCPGNVTSLARRQLLHWPEVHFKIKSLISEEEKGDCFHRFLNSYPFLKKIFFVFVLFRRGRVAYFYFYPILPPLPAKRPRAGMS